MSGIQMTIAGYVLMFGAPLWMALRFRRDPRTEEPISFMSLDTWWKMVVMISLGMIMTILGAAPR